MSSPSSLALHVLGSFRAFVDGVEVDDGRWARRKAKLLVKLLAIHSHHKLHREEVMDLLWPDLDPSSAANNLHKTIHQARRALEPGLPAREASRFLHIHDQQVSLRAPAELWIDADIFEQHAARAIAANDPNECSAALARYGGDLLQEDMYEEWAAPRREHLRSLSQTLLERVVRFCQDRGDYQHALAHLLDLVGSDPLNEDAHRRLMLLYALSGARHKALQQYHRCVDLLDAELGVAPEPATEALHARILDERIRHVAAVEEPTERAGARSERDAVAVHHNLPPEFSSFVGRGWALAEARQAIARSRLVTLVGPGGIGKTRLALRLAAEELSAFSDGVWFVDLAPVGDSRHVWRTVCATVGARESGDVAADRATLDHLRTRQTLLVFDNCEHLVDEVARVASAILAGCPDAKLIATSRESLGVVGESIQQIQPLSVPASEQAMFVGTVMEFEASRLFYDRAHTSDPSFLVTDQNAHELAAICRRLDGIPLAIELAAAYAGLLGLGQILARLDARFRLLVSGVRTAPARHQTLKATIDWSYNLLDDRERTTLRRLSVFAGGATLDAAESVCARIAESLGESAASNVLASLRSLVQKSLLVVDRRFEEPCYRFLDTIREYAVERLRLADEEPAALDAHRLWCLELAERAHAHFGTSSEREWMDRLDAECDNIRAALSWRLRDTSGAEDVLKFCALLGNFWSVRGYSPEGRGWLAAALEAGSHVAGVLRAEAIEATLMCHHDYAEHQRLLEQSLAIWEKVGDEQACARARQLLASALVNVGEYDRARSIHLQNLEVYRRLGDRRGEGVTLFGLGFVAMSRCDYAEARTNFENSLAIARELGDRRRESLLLHNLGETALRLGDLEHAERVLAETLDAARSLGFKILEGRTQHLLGFAAIERGDVSSARTWLREALQGQRETGDSEGIAYALDGMAGVYALDGDCERAVKLAGAAEAIRDAIKVVRSAAEIEAADRWICAAREALGPERAARVFADGTALDMNVVVDYALGVR